jgi:hypothetical protein
MSGIQLVYFMIIACKNAHNFQSEHVYIYCSICTSFWKDTGHNPIHASDFLNLHFTQSIRTNVGSAQFLFGAEELLTLSVLVFKDCINKKHHALYFRKLITATIMKY